MDSKLRFAPFVSHIDLGFYTNLFKTKLEHDKLDDSARPMVGLYVPASLDPHGGAKMMIHPDALTGQRVPENHIRADAFVKNTNTLDEFKDADKTALIRNAARQVWEAIQDGTIYECPSILSHFFILSYADLKRHKFTYWAAYPCLHSDPTWVRTSPDERLTSAESTDLVEKVGTWRYGVDERKRGFFLAKKVRTSTPSADMDSRPETPTASDYEWAVSGLGAFEKGFFDGIPERNRYVCFVDPSTFEDSPGWPLRNLLVLIRQRYRLSAAKILCYRDIHARRHAAQSLILNLGMESVPRDLGLKEIPKVTGWERNANNKLAAKLINLNDSMDPVSIAENAVDLNLKLMKWRIAPNLDLDAIKNSSCLLLGAGTLGGYVARGLIAWGVRNITFVDYGTISYSNPVRQPLYKHEDCVGVKPKAATAAQSLKEIFPGVTSEGHSLEVPMLGHPPLDTEKTKRDFEILKELVAAHDAIFLLMDSRESRWLPTVMGKAEGKLVLNAALGFDTWVAMRHGAEPEGEDKSTLGCYFCNDVVAPGDSTKNQTLDQQCTVTRPGVSFEATGKLVELFASTVQHPKGKHAPAPADSDDRSDPDAASSAFGRVAHQYRGDIGENKLYTLRGESYQYCSACSPKILEAYRNEGWNFVERALKDKGYVLELSGLAEVQRRAEEMAQVMEEEDLSGMDDDGDGELLL